MVAQHRGAADAGLMLLLTAALLAASGFPAADSIPGTNWTKADWRIFSSKVRWGAANGIETLPLGRAIAKLGATFVGTKYTPATLEVPGPERLVVNLRELDCVTFVETNLALVAFIRRDGVRLLRRPSEARSRFEAYLRQLRYRDGIIDGYPSRLHYFSEWLAERAGKGEVELLAERLGGVADSEGIHFMTGHIGSYRQLADSALVPVIAAMEARLSAMGPRWYLPKAAVAGAASEIKDGDIIAATSTLPGLDIAHTGFAIWRRGRLHLLHAPLVGKTVEVSPLPLADRLQTIKTQDGIMVARPLSALLGGLDRPEAAPR